MQLTFFVVLLGKKQGFPPARREDLRMHVDNVGRLVGHGGGHVHQHAPPIRAEDDDRGVEAHRRVRLGVQHGRALERDAWMFAIGDEPRSATKASLIVALRAPQRWNWSRSSPARSSGAPNASWWR